ncbi:MAG: ribulose-phosphate 3-epimerase-like [Candidatus Wolfebacteria bacterium GW2011_GWB1_47_1]|uniref:Ribulose-phosphate 3-epimerase-like n=1 Tax=Candidatus Wolfebacteria bacterium GW2011_GWB1_47_1 TaxID=1619007 RepID=A0A0G4ATR1_9BACT|nr:MAG: ribulose-phosphate 3-epimerase-like [Candidatus Wolfebacteria bacterium GW2011_GWB1_47_1]
MKVIPAINCTTFAQVTKRIKEAQNVLPKGGWLQIDVSDGKFNQNKSWNEPKKLAKWLKDNKVEGINFEAHLMVTDPKLWAMQWLEAGARRVVVHVEALTPNDILFLKGFGKGRIGIAIIPGSPIKAVERYVEHFSFIQLLAVKPGYSGQKLDRKVLEKIVFLKALYPNVTIEVDGGVNASTAPTIKDAGADIVVVGSYIFEAADKGKAYRELKKI